MKWRVSVATRSGGAVVNTIARTPCNARLRFAFFLYRRCSAATSRAVTLRRLTTWPRRRRVTRHKITNQQSLARYSYCTFFSRRLPSSHDFEVVHRSLLHRTRFSSAHDKRLRRLINKTVANPRHIAGCCRLGSFQQLTCGPLPRANFHVYRGNVSPLRGEKPIFGPVSKNSTGMAALRAGLPVINYV